MTESDRRPVPPYVPWRSFETYIDGLQAFGPAMPNVIDRDSMRTFSGSTQAWLLSALRSLNMIDEHGIPRPRLKQLVAATPDQRKSLYKQIIDAEYKFLSDINLQGATPKQIDAAFESTGATGDTVRKCIAFFVGMAKAADIPLSPLIEKVRRRPSSNGQKKKPKPAPTPQHRNPNDGTVQHVPYTPPVERPVFQVLYDLLDPGMTQAEQEAVWTLLQYLKKREAAE